MEDNNHFYSIAGLESIPLCATSISVFPSGLLLDPRCLLQLEVGVALCRAVKGLHFGSLRADQEDHVVEADHNQGDVVVHVYLLNTESIVVKYIISWLPFNSFIYSLCQFRQK